MILSERELSTKRGKTFKSFPIQSRHILLKLKSSDNSIMYEIHKFLYLHSNAKFFLLHLMINITSMQNII